MNATALDVIEGRSRWAADVGDAVAWLRSLPDDSIDLLFTSPPYEDARTYGLPPLPKGQEWVSWIAQVVIAAAPKVKGLIAINCEAKTDGYKYSCVPYLLMADLHRDGFNLRRPAFFHRIGIPGSGGPDWLRADIEPVICITRPGRLPWSDSTACGHPPRWAPGGEMSNRLSSGTRVNQWGKFGSATGMNSTKNGVPVPNSEPRPSHVTVNAAAPDDTPSLFDDGERAELGPGRNAHGVQRIGKDVGGRRGNDDRKAGDNEMPFAQRKLVRTKRTPGREEESYTVPAIANPGNVISRTYSADEVAALLEQAADISHHNVGEGVMGHPLAHENEAPFPVALAEFFVKSFCPLDGIVADCFMGSGSCIHAALNHGRRAVGCDLRQSQVDLTRRRMSSVTGSLLTLIPEESRP